jgi:hypothetical protein
MHHRPKKKNALFACGLRVCANTESREIAEELWMTPGVK